jgi:2-oxoglutarate ferredoxin oxidoreductase subunit alpha
LPRAFYLAEKHRTPVIFLTDFAMMVSRASIAEVPAAVLPLAEARRERALPGQEGKMHHLTGNQRGRSGLPTELTKDRLEFFDKRLATLPQEVEESFSLVEGGKELLIVATGSIRGAVEVALRELKGQASALLPRILSPLPVRELQPVIDQHERVLVLDSNAKGQLLKLLRTNFCSHHKFSALKKYDGEPFTPEEIVKRAREVLLYDGE